MASLGCSVSLLGPYAPTTWSVKGYFWMETWGIVRAGQAENLASCRSQAFLREGADPEIEGGQAGRGAEEPQRPAAFRNCPFHRVASLGRLSSPNPGFKGGLQET